MSSTAVFAVEMYCRCPATGVLRMPRTPREKRSVHCLSFEVPRRYGTSICEFSSTYSMSWAVYERKFSRNDQLIYKISFQGCSCICRSHRARRDHCVYRAKASKHCACLAAAVHTSRRSCPSIIPQLGANLVFHRVILDSSFEYLTRQSLCLMLDWSPCPGESTHAGYQHPDWS